jgi:5-methylcytosine-specific restriction endonuclease McrA
MVTYRGDVLIWLCGVGEGGPFEQGICVWCGELIELVDPDDYRRAQRVRHRGDECEVGDRNCLREFQRARVWKARDLVEIRGDPCCVDCGDIEAVWEADHEVPLADGGAHCPTNIVRRCRRCHRAKTIRENRERARRRRVGDPVSG